MSSTCTGGAVAGTVAGCSGGMFGASVCADPDADGDGGTGGTAVVSAAASGRVCAPAAGIDDSGTAETDDAAVGVDAAVVSVDVGADVPHIVV